MAKFERELVESALAQHDYSWAAAARAPGVDRGNLVRLAKRLGLPTDRRALARRGGQGAAQPAGHWSS